MARAVLAAVLFATAIAASVPAGAQNPTGPLACTGGDETGREIATTSLSSPLFGFLSERYGASDRCSVTLQDGTYDVRIGFPGGAGMTVTASPDIGVAAYGADFAAGRPSQSEATGMLQDLELWAAAPDGCGISPEEMDAGLTGPGASLTVEGAVCNCRAELMRDATGISRLRFGSAC